VIVITEGLKMKVQVKGYATFRIDYTTHTSLETLYAEMDDGKILVTAERPVSVMWPTKSATWIDSGLDHDGLKKVAMFIGNYQLEL
jgi:hypothetical protein